VVGPAVTTANSTATTTFLQ